MLVAQIADNVAPCGEPLSREELELAGERVRMVTYERSDRFSIHDVVVVRGDEAFYLSNVVPQGALDARQRFLSAPETFEFTTYWRVREARTTRLEPPPAQLAQYE